MRERLPLASICKEAENIWEDQWRVRAALHSGTKPQNVSRFLSVEDRFDSREDTLGSALILSAYASSKTSKSGKGHRDVSIGNRFDSYLDIVGAPVHGGRGSRLNSDIDHVSKRHNTEGGSMSAELEDSVRVQHRGRTPTRGEYVRIRSRL